MIMDKLPPPPYDVVADEEDQKYKQYQIEHPAVVASTGHSFDSFHAATEEATSCVKIFIHVAQQTVLALDFIPNVN